MKCPACCQEAIIVFHPDDIQKWRCDKCSPELKDLLDFDLVRIPDFIKLVEVFKKVYERHPFYKEQVLPVWMAGPIDSVFTVLGLLLKKP